MSAFWGPLRRLVLGISPEETSFVRRGFQGGSSGARERLELVGRTFVVGYHAALEDGRLEVLVPRLKAVGHELCGFAFEGAAMGLALLDRVTPWRRNRVAAFLAGAGGAHVYMVHIGVGWVLARLGGSIERTLAPLDPLLRWLAIDGYGFHEGFFHWRRYLQGQPIPRRITGYASRAFDQGLGRSLWFVDGADVARIPRTIAGFPSERRGDLWSGIGLACTYAGGVDEAELHALRESAGPFHPQLAQAAAFAAKARECAGNVVPYTQLACQTLCGLSAEEAAHLTDSALENLPADGPEPSYEMWRRRVQQQLSHRWRSGE